MRTRHLLLLFLALWSVGCSVQSAVSESRSSPTPLSAATVTVPFAPTAVPTATALPTSTPTPTTTNTPFPTATPGPEASFHRLVLIDQEEQMMHVYQDGQLIRSIPCSTGLPGEETHTPAWEGEVGHYVGTFFSFGVYADHGWYLFDHYGAMLIHSAPYLTENGVKVYQELDLLGVRPSSHGCIRLPPEAAEWFTEWQPQGAHVIITPPRQE